MKNLDILAIEDLRLILAIAEEGSLTAGAARMRIGQSNASYSLRKIQNAFQADLFIRKGRKLVPSEFGWHAYTHIKSMLDEFQSVLHPPVFNPEDEFTLNFGATEYETIAVFPHIQSLLKTHAPNARLRIVLLDTTDTWGQLERLDFIFVPVDIRSDSVQAMEILEDTSVVFYDSSMRDAPETLSQFATARHGIASFDGGTSTNTDALLAKENLQREVVISVFGFSALAGLMRSTDVITTLPKRLADSVFADFAQCDCPLRDDPMKLFLCWEKVKDERGKIRWFTDLMAEHQI